MIHTILINFIYRSSFSSILLWLHNYADSRWLHCREIWREKSIRICNTGKQFVDIVNSSRCKRTLGVIICAEDGWRALWGLLIIWLIASVVHLFAGQIIFADFINVFGWHY